MGEVAVPSTYGASEQTSHATSPRVASASLLPLVALITASLPAIWLSARTGESTSRFTGLEVPVLRYALMALVTAALLGVLIEGIILDRWPLNVPAVAATALLLIAALMLALEEVAASLIPTSFLPTSIRRLTVDVYGGLGIWIAAFASLALVVSARVDGGALGLTRSAWAAAQRLPVRWLSAFACAGVAVAVAAWARYQPWAAGTAGSEHVEVPGWSLPIIGPASLVAVLLLAASATVLAVHRNLAAALVLAVSGWALSFMAAIVLIATSTLARVEVDQYLPDPVEQYGPAIHLRWGVWLMFATGCLAAGCGSAIVYLIEREAR